MKDVKSILKIMIKYSQIIIPVLLFPFIIFSGCNSKDDSSEFNLPDNELSADKETELQTKEEFLRLKEEALKEKERLLDTVLSRDTLPPVDTTTKKPTVNRKQQSNIEKEKELNKRVSNPSSTINDYLEYIKRGVNRDGNFDKNMKNASGLWEKRSVDVFKRNYKDTKKFQVIADPKVVRQSDNTATVRVKVKQTEVVNNQNKDVEMEVVYDLVADKNGNWKIKSNRVVRK